MTERGGERKGKKLSVCGRKDGCQAAEDSLGIIELAEQAPGGYKLRFGAQQVGGSIFGEFGKRESSARVSTFGGKSKLGIGTTN